MPNPEGDNQKRTYVLSHGAWHGAWCWDYLTPYLQKAGHDVIAVDLPTDDPNADFDDYAQVIKTRIAGRNNVHLVGHSRSGNVIPRVAQITDIQHLIYLSSPLPVFAELEGTDIMQKAPRRNFAEFLAGIIQLESGLTQYDPAVAPEVFYNMCAPEQSAWATSQLRLQKRIISPNYAVSMPKVPTSYIYGTQDRVIYPEYSRYVAKNILGIEPIEIISDHSPFISTPELLSVELLKL